MIPVLWANQYNIMSHSSELPACLNKFLAILETVEAAIETQAAAVNKKTMANTKADKPNGMPRKMESGRTSIPPLTKTQRNRKNTVNSVRMESLGVITSPTLELSKNTVLPK